MEMNMAKFSEKLVALLELAKKKKNVLEYQEINDFFKDMPLDTEQMEKVFEFMEAGGVDVLRITENADELILDDDAELDNFDSEEEIELEKIENTFGIFNPCIHRISGCTCNRGNYVSFLSAHSVDY